MKISPSRLPPLSPADLGLGVAIVLTISSFWFMGNFHSRHDGDSLIHSLNSLYHWTVFVWEYDHIGSLLSLLAQIITRPYLNVMAISALSSFFFLTGLAIWGRLISRITFTESSLWVALLVPIVLTQKAIFQNGSHSISSGTALFFSGWYVFLLQRYLNEPRSLLLVPALFGLAFLATYLSKIAFIPISTVTFGLLWINRPLTWRRIVTIGACLALALLCYQQLEQASPYRKDYTLQLVNLPIALPRLLGNLGSKAMTGIAWLATPVLMALYRPTRRNPLFLSLGAGVLIQTLIISSSRWATINGYAAHYLFDLSFLVLLAALGLAVSLTRQWLPAGAQRGLPLVLAVGAIGLNAYLWDAFHPANPLTRMDLTIGKNTPDIVAAECDLIAGDYWKAWPAMLAVNDYYYRNNVLDPGSHRRRRVYAITSLAASTEGIWRPILDMPDARVCSLSGDEAGYKRSISSYAPEIALQIFPVAQIGQVIVHRVLTTPLQSVSLDFDQLVPGKGWSTEESYPNGVTFQWMNSTDATILLPLATDRDMHIEFRVIYTMSPDILQSLSLHVNGESVALSSMGEIGGGTVFYGSIPHSVLETKSQITLLTFQISHTLIPRFVMPDSDDPRNLGLALDWLHIQGAPVP